MIGRVLALAGGLSGAAGLSQFPEYAQQYTQRLAGAVDELTLFVEEFDRDARSLGLGRSEALVELAQGGEMGAARAKTVAETIDRRERLARDLETLRTAGPFTRALNARRFSDGDIARKAWQDFRPALPFTFEGAVFGGTGFVLGMLGMAIMVWGLRLPFRNRNRDVSDPDRPKSA